MTNQWVLVTGGARRLGRAFCQEFARSGWNVICHYNNSPGDALETCRLVQEMGASAVSLQCDLSDGAARKDLVSQAIALSGGRLSALVNNASSFLADTGSDFSLDQLRTQFELNAIAPIDLGRWFARLLPLRECDAAPSIIHVLDQKVLNLNRDYFSYTLAKLALHRAVELQAQALAPHVRVVGLAPGLVLVSGPQDEKNFLTARSANLLCRPTAVGEIATTAVFLASNPAITGVTLCVDSGQHLVPTSRDVMFIADQFLQSTNGNTCTPS